MRTRVALALGAIAILSAGCTPTPRAPSQAPRSPGITATSTVPIEPRSAVAPNVWTHQNIGFTNGWGISAIPSSVSATDAAIRLIRSDRVAKGIDLYPPAASGASRDGALSLVRIVPYGLTATGEQLSDEAFVTSGDFEILVDTAGTGRRGSFLMWRDAKGRWAYGFPRGWRSDPIWAAASNPNTQLRALQRDDGLLFVMVTTPGAGSVLYLPGGSTIPGVTPMLGDTVITSDTAFPTSAFQEPARGSR